MSVHFFSEKFAFFQKKTYFCSRNKELRRMRKILYFILLVAIVGIAGNDCRSQSFVVNSRTRTFSRPYGNDVKVRFFGSRGDMLIYNYDYLSSENVFTCRVAPGHPDANRYPLMSESNTFGGIGYTVNDMVVVGNKCYFCGKKIVPIGMEQGENGLYTTVYDSMGYIGEMALDSVTDADNGNIKYRIWPIRETNNLYRIDATARLNGEGNSDTLVGMVGIDSLDHKTCLVLLNKSGVTWSERRLLYPNRNTSETFCDMVFSDRDIAVVSRFADSNFFFAMRTARTDDVFFYNDYTGLDTLYKFNTRQMITKISQKNKSWHFNNVGIRLSAIPNSNEVNVAYESYKSRPYGVHDEMSQTSLFLMELPAYPGAGIRMNDAMNVDAGIKDIGSFSDMAYVVYGNKVALLHRSPNGFYLSGAMQMVTWNNVGDIDNYYSPDDESLTSLDVYNGHQVWVAGHRTTHNDSIVQFYQHAQYTSPSCYLGGQQSAEQLSPIPDAEVDTCTLGKIDPYKLWSGWKRIGAQRVSITQRCYIITEGRAEDGEDWIEDEYEE